MKNLKVSLVAMPNMDLQYPSLAVAYLSAFLKEKDVEISAHSFNTKFKNIKLNNFIKDAQHNWELFNSILLESDVFKNYKLKHKSVFLDLMLEHCLHEVLKNSPSIVGFSVFQTNFLPSLLLAKKIKQTETNIKIIFGGPQCDFNDRGHFFIQSGFVDAVVVGEGEQVFYELIKKIDAGRLNSCPGAMIKNGHEIIYGGNTTHGLDMDSLPFPDFSFFKPKEIKSEPMLPISFNRGCRARCKFCGERAYWLSYRQMSVHRAIEMLIHMQKRHFTRSFLLAQSLVNADLKWLSDFCDAIIEQKISVYWAGNARIHPKMNKQLLNKMYQAGCRALFFGTESGSQKVLNQMKKGITIPITRKVIKATWESGIWVHTYWILGFPTETQDDSIKTLDFIIENYDHIDSHFFHFFLMDKRSRIYKELPDRAITAYKNKQLKELFGNNLPEGMKRKCDKDNMNFLADTMSAVNKMGNLYTDNWPNTRKKKSFKKRKERLNLLLTFILLRYHLRYKDNRNKLEQIKISKTALLRIYAKITQEYGLNYDYRKYQREVAKRIFDELLL